MQVWELLSRFGTGRAKIRAQDCRGFPHSCTGDKILPSTKPDKVARTYATLSSAEQALCYAAIAFDHGTANRATLRNAVQQWERAVKAVEALAFLPGASPPTEPALFPDLEDTVVAKVANRKSTTTTTTPTKSTDGGLTEDVKPLESRYTTWLSPYAAAWKTQYRGTPNFRFLARYLKPLHDEHGVEKVLAHWEAYLREVPGTYANPGRFAATFGQWDPVAVRAQKDPTAPRPGETSDEYIGRMNG